MEYRNMLSKMIKYFPSWSDIRKRTDSSIGGALLKSYAMESDNIQEAIDDFKKDFFLLYYSGRESDIVDYLLYTQVGDIDTENLKVIDMELADSVSDFYSNLQSKFYYVDGYILIHDKSGHEENDIIEYTVGNYTYKSKLLLRAVWNVFDEFALFAGLKRMDKETNLQLANRTYAVFKTPASSDEGHLKNSICNILYNIENISHDDIIIEKANADNMNIEDEEYGTLYENIAQYDKDLLRTKKWNVSNWENSFAKMRYLPHSWDKEIASYQNGVGYNDSCKVDFIDNINNADTTNLNVSYYKKSQNAITEYVKNNNIETTIPLKLTKYSNTISGTDVEYKIKATEAVVVDLNNIYIKAYQEMSGKINCYIDSLVERLDNVMEVANNEIDGNNIYKLVFKAKEAYSDMSVAKLLLRESNGTVHDLRVENSTFEIKDNTLVNKNIKKHITSLKDCASSYNMANASNGIKIDSIADYGSVDVDVSDIGYNIIDVKVSCDEVNITDNTALVSYNGFNLIDNYTLEATGTDSVSNIIISMKCNSYSFDLVEAVNQASQGAIEVTTYIDGVASTMRYFSAQKISNSFKELTNVRIVIRKDGYYPVRVANISAARYEIEYSLDNGQIIKNSMYMMLPAYSGNNTLHIKVNGYTQISPVIEHIHIGSSLINSSYEVLLDSLNAGERYSLDIESTCKISLYYSEDNGTTFKLYSDDYNTHSTYVNNTNDTGYIVVDTSDFVEIVSSTPPLYSNGSRKYIELLPGRSITSITINGRYLKEVESYTLAHYISSANKTVYISQGCNSFLVKDGTNVEKVDLKRELLNSAATIFKVSNVGRDMDSVFVIDNNETNEIISDTINNNFNKLILRPKNKTEYIAYNKTAMISSIKHNIEIANTFYPIMDNNQMMLYVIEQISTPDFNSDASFRKYDNINNWHYDNWSLGVPEYGITVTVDINMNNASVYELNIVQMSQKYILSDNIMLEDTYVINSEEHELGEYIIETQSGISVVSSDSVFSELIIAEEDLFNKLTYSNIDSIVDVLLEDGTQIQKSAYSILKQEGILIWNDESYVGKTILIEYIYKKPAYLKYTDLNYLYQAVSYSVDAYELIKTVTYQNLSDKDEVLIDSVTYDKLITRCSNPSFQTVVNDDTITINKIGSEDKLAIHYGYVYDGGNEYWLFNNRYKDKFDQLGDVTFFNTKKINGILYFNKESSNYLPNSNMNRNNLRLLCNMDFRDRDFTTTNIVSVLSSCESYANWYSFNMSEVSIEQLDDSFGLRFTSNGDASYAALNITDYVHNGYILSLVASGDIKCSIAKEYIIDDMPFRKSLCVDKLEDMQDYMGVYKYHIFDNISDDTRYYLFVQGNGIIDDIISEEYTSLESLQDKHKRDIYRIGFEVEEALVPDTEYPIYFNSDIGLSYEGLQVALNGEEISMGSNVDYGMTLIEKVKLEECSTDYGKLEKEYIIAERDTVLTTPIIYCDNGNSVLKGIFKVNDVFINRFSNFEISIYNSMSKNGQFSKVSTTTNSNICQCSLGNKKGSYYYAEIKIPSNHIVNNIEFYVIYGENDSHPLSIRNNNYGTITTSLYDIGVEGSFKVNSIDYQSNYPENVKFYIRACRSNKDDIVWTQWKEIDINKEVVFDKYRFFQLRASVYGEETKLTVNKVVLGVI